MIDISRVTSRHDSQPSQPTNPTTLSPRPTQRTSGVAADAGARPVAGSGRLVYVDEVFGMVRLLLDGRERRVGSIGSNISALENKGTPMQKDCRSAAVLGRYRSATVGTDKRERQRANKAVKEQQAARAETRQKGTRLSVIIIGAIAGVLGIALIANTFIGGDEDEATPTTLPEVNEDASTSGEVFEPTGEFVPEGCPSPDGSGAMQAPFESAPPMCLDPAKEYSALVTTNKGELTIELDEEKAPLAANNFVFLARNEYFDDTTCHRIIPDFVVQCGDPTGTGTGGPGYSFPDELPEAGEYQIGSIAMANSGPDTNGSQFFIITGENGAALPPSYSLFGAVSAGLDDTVVDMAAAGTADGTPSEPVDIQSIVIITN
jgi:cyclophilin family peptidyl-prolyl cis-trans isomerase